MRLYARIQTPTEEADWLLKIPPAQLALWLAAALLALVNATHAHTHMHTRAAGEREYVMV